MLVSIIYHPRRTTPYLVQPTGILNESAIGAAEVRDYTLNHTSVVNEQEFGAPSVLVSKRYLTLSGVVNEQAFGNNVPRKLHDLLPTGVVNDQEFGGPMLAVTKYRLFPSGVENDNLIGAPEMDFGADPNYANDGGTGNRTDQVLVTSAKAALPTGGGTWDNFVDGAFGNNGTDGLFNSNDSGHIVYFDFRGIASGAAVMQCINEFKWYQQNTASHGTWDLHGWNGNGWTALKSGFTLGGATLDTESFSNTAGYMVYRLTQVSGTWSSSPWVQEIEFQIDAIGTITDTTSFANTGGTGDRSALITITSTATVASGSIANLINGNTTETTTFFNGGQTGREIKFDFGSGHSAIIDGIKWYQSGTQNHGTWILQGSNDDSTWEDLGTPFVFDGVAGAGKEFTHARGNVKAYRYYRLMQLYGSTSNGPFIQEIEFKIRNYV